jgi:hypothetical protein
VLLGSDGTTWDAGDPKPSEPAAEAQKRWDRKSTLDADGRTAAKAYRKHASRFLAECVQASAQTG